jgi:protein-S-isoprenylcysteine O-methyltransferase Ste14
MTMDDKIFFGWLGIGLTTHTVRTLYEIAKANKRLKPGKVSFVVMLCNMTLLWVSWIRMCDTDVVRIPVPDAIRYGGLTLFIGGVVLFLVGLLTIKALETHKGDMVTWGIYSKIRHPMYLSFILWLIGYSLYSGAALSFIISAVFIANILFWRYLEEKELTERYPLYNEYRNKTLF